VDAIEVGRDRAPIRVQPIVCAGRVRLHQVAPCLGAVNLANLGSIAVRPNVPDGRWAGVQARFPANLEEHAPQWAYERIYGSSAERTAALPLFLARYNLNRPHSSLGHKPPASRLTKVMGNYI
jgi:hypothetical protein